MVSVQTVNAKCRVEGRSMIIAIMVERLYKYRIVSDGLKIERHQLLYSPHNANLLL